MSLAILSLVGFCILLLILILYFCFWAHRKATFLSATSYNTPHTLVVRRCIQTHHRHRPGRCPGHIRPTNATIYTIPFRVHSAENAQQQQHYVTQPPPPYDKFWARPTPQVLLVTSQNTDLPPPTYDEVANTTPVGGENTFVDSVFSSSIPTNKNTSDSSNAKDAN